MDTFFPAIHDSMIIKRQHDRIVFVIIPAIRGQRVLPSTGARNKTHSLLDEIVIFKALDGNLNALKKETETTAEEEEEIIDQIDLLDYSSSSDEDEYSESEDNAPTGASALSNVTGKFHLLTST